MAEKHKIADSEAALAGEIPVNKAKLLRINGKPICLARTAAGFFAIDDLCPHLGFSLSKGTFNYLNEVVCPWHSYRYNLQTGAECEYRTRNAKTYPLEITSDGVFLSL